MKKRMLLPLIFLLTFALWLTSTTAQQEWVLHKTLTRGGTVTAVAFSQSGRQLAVGTSWSDAGYDDLRIYDGNTFSSLRGFNRANGVYQVAFRKGWYEIAVAWINGGSKSLELYNTKTGSRIATFGEASQKPGSTASVELVTYRPDGKRLAVYSSNIGAQIWYTDHQNGARRRLRILNGSGNLDITGLAWSPNGQILAGACGDGTVRLWNPDTGVNWAILRRHTGAVRAVAFSPNGRMLASVSYESPFVVFVGY